jgi:hypothetical protein
MVPVWILERPMKAKIKLALQRAEMRSGCDPDAAPPDDLRRKIAALVLAYGRSWSATRIARYFGWPRADVERWIESGKPLL